MSGAAIKGKKAASKNAYRRAKKKQQRTETPSEAGESARESESPAPESDSNNDAQAVKPADLLVVDDIANQYDLDDPNFELYKSVFEKFREPTEEEVATKDEEKAEIIYSDDDIPDEEDDGKPKISKKQRKQMNKVSVAQLKPKSLGPSSSSGLTCLRQIPSCSSPSRPQRTPSLCPLTGRSSVSICPRNVALKSRLLHYPNSYKRLVLQR